MPLFGRNIFGDNHGFDDFFGDDVTFFCDVSDVSSFLPASVVDDIAVVVVDVVVVAGAVSEATFLGELSRRTGILDPVFRKGTDFRQFTGKLSIFSLLTMHSHNHHCSN